MSQSEDSEPAEGNEEPEMPASNDVRPAESRNSEIHADSESQRQEPKQQAVPHTSDNTEHTPRHGQETDGLKRESRHQSPKKQHTHKKPSSAKARPKKSEENDDEISFDLTRFLAFFKKGKETAFHGSAGKKADKKRFFDIEEDEGDGRQDGDNDEKENNKSRALMHGKKTTSGKDKQKSNDANETNTLIRKEESLVRKEKKESHHDVEDEKLNFDMAKVKSFLSSKTFATIVIVLLVLIPVFLSVFLRSYPADLPITHDMAENVVVGGIKNSIRSQILQQYPTLGSNELSAEVEKQYAMLMAEQGKAVEDQIKLQADYFKSKFQDDSGQTYMLSIDPYHYYQRSLNILTYGHIGDTLKDGKPYSTYMFAPKGRFLTANLHDYMGAYLYRLISFFDKDTTLLFAMFWLPVLFSALAVIPAFFIARRKAGNLGGFIAGFIVAVHPAFLGRTTAGAPDTDPYAVFFPLLIIWVFFEAFYSKGITKKIILAALSGFFVAVFSGTWSGWWYVFDFIVIAIVSHLIYEMIKISVNKRKIQELFKKKKFQNEIYIMGVFVLASVVFTILIRDLPTLLSALKAPLSFIRIQQASFTLERLWPNVYTTVAELNTVSISGIINQIGGRVFFVISSLGIIFALLPKKINTRHMMILGGSLLWFMIFSGPKFQALNVIKFTILYLLPVAAALVLDLRFTRAKDKERIDISSEVGAMDLKYALLLAVWFAGTMYASIKGIRFIMILVPAFAIAMGICFGVIYDLVSKMLSKEVKIPLFVSRTVIIVIILIIIGAVPSFSSTQHECPLWPSNSMGCNGYRNGYGELPIIDDGWYELLGDVREGTPKDTIINSWWDFGHWFKAVADRRVTFDGASQNTPMAHWVGKALLTDDEDETIAILRMLDCGSNDAFELVNARRNDTLSSVKLVKEIIMLDKAEAKERLAEDGFSDEEADAVLEKTHCNPPKNIFITSEDMVGKAGVWAHFGSWDFDRAYQHNLVDGYPYDYAISEMQSRFGMTEQEAIQRYYEISALATDRESNDWIAPWPAYVVNTLRRCTNQSTNVTCYYNVAIGSENNYRIALEKAVVNMENPELVELTFAFIDGNGAKAGESKGKPAQMVVGDDKHMSSYKMEESNFPYAVLVIENPGGTYDSLVADPALVSSTFTKLFYLDGRYMGHFEKFSEKMTVGGDKLVAWDVLW